MDTNHKDHPFYLSERKFLNQDNKGGMAAYQIKAGIYDSDGLDSYDLTLSDCNRQIQLEFYIGSDNFENAIYKCGQLINLFTTMHNNMCVQRDLNNAKPKHITTEDSPEEEAND